MLVEATNINSASVSVNDMTVPKNNPTENDIEAFSQALFGTRATVPEESLSNALRTQSMAVESSFATAGSRANLLNEPTQMLAIQANVLKSVAKVELTAKVAGSLAQSINKLVSMQ